MSWARPAPGLERSPWALTLQQSRPPATLPAGAGDKGGKQSYGPARTSSGEDINHLATSMLLEFPVPSLLCRAQSRTLELGNLCGLLAVMIGVGDVRAREVAQPGH